MKKINSFLFALLGILLLVSCDNKGLKKTKSGLLYKIISDEKNPVVKKGQFIKLSFTSENQRCKRYRSVHFRQQSACLCKNRQCTVKCIQSCRNIFHY